MEAYHEVVTVEFALESVGKAAGEGDGLGEARAQRPARAWSLYSPEGREAVGHPAGHAGAGGDAGGGGGGGGVEEARRLVWGTDAAAGREACVATVCAAMGRVPPWGSDEGEHSDGEGRDGGGRPCRSLELPLEAGNTTGGTLELPSRPQVTLRANLRRVPRGCRAGCYAGVVGRASRDEAGVTHTRER